MKRDVSDKLVSHLDKILAEFYTLQERAGRAPVRVTANSLRLTLRGSSQWPKQLLNR